MIKDGVNSAAFVLVEVGFIATNTLNLATVTEICTMMTQESPSDSMKEAEADSKETPYLLNKTLANKNLPIPNKTRLLVAYILH